MGRVMPPPWSYASEMAAHIRQTLQELGSAEGVRVIYGGSVNARTIATIAAEPLFDGVLAGSASVNASVFLQIVQAYC
jgi:triosephosphate isomerase